MRRASTETAPVAVVEILPLGVYRLGQVKDLLGLYATTIRAERKAGRLRVGRRGRRYFVLGAWLWEWLEKGELPSRQTGRAVESARLANGARGDKES